MQSPFEHTNESDTIISFQLPYLGMNTVPAHVYSPQKQQVEAPQPPVETLQPPVETLQQVEEHPINNFSKKPFTFGQPTPAQPPAFGCMGNISSKKVEPGFPSFMTSTMTSTSCIPTLGCNLGQPPKVQYYTFNPQTGYKPVDINMKFSPQPDKKVIINSLYDELKKIRGQIELLNKSTVEFYHSIRYILR